VSALQPSPRKPLLKIPRILELGVLVSLLLGSPAGALEDRPAGVVVSSVAPRSPGAAAGLAPGDLILSWSSEAASGGVSSPYDLVPPDLEESSRRAVTLYGRRGSEERSWTLTSRDWGIEVRPVAESAGPASDGRLAAWFLERQAKALGDAGKWAEADAPFEEAVAALERAPDPRGAAHLLRSWGVTFEKRGAWDEAIRRYEKALALDRTMAPKSLAVARDLNVLGVATAKKGGYDAAEELLKQSLAMREELAPGSVEVAQSLNNLGILARLRGRLTAAEEYLLRGEEIQRRRAPDTVDHALLFLNLGNVAQNRGELEKAERLHRRALAIFEAIDPDGGGVKGCLQNLVNLAFRRGDLAAADDLLRRMLALQERKWPDEWESWSTLVSLGHIASERRDLDAAEIHYRRSLALQEKISPEGREMALSLGSLGEVAALRGDFATARAYLQRAQSIEEKLDPESLDTAAGLEDLARLEMDSGGDLALAERLLQRALALYEKEAPRSLEVSIILRNLGDLMGRRGDLEKSLELHRQALDLQHKLAPETLAEAQVLHSLGLTERRAGRSEEGTRSLCRAIDVLDRQRARIGGTQEAKTAFEATLGGYYHACLTGLLELGRSAEAFHVLERGRARSFLALLGKRDLRLSDLPPELIAERRRVNTEYDRVQSRLASLSAGKDDAEIERITGELSDLRTLQEEVSEKIRRVSPRSSALENPEPLDLEGARRALDPGTVLLTYAVAPERTWLFVVQAADAGGSGLSVFSIASGAEPLRGEVEAFRLLLNNPRSDRAELRTRARRLYDLLVRPAEDGIAGARRILVSADGPLHTLAFAALMRGDRYLVEQKPIHSVLSATVYAELVRSRPAPQDPGEQKLTAFGDPAYRPVAPDALSDPEVREAVRRGLSLLPLPSSGREVKAIAALYPEAEVYLGREATEEKAKSIGKESRLVHFACHGLLDERFPLNSALVLTLPEKQAEGQDNGLLQAWEIFENVRLDADLVTLSACDTALGREMGGEGLVGLTRAFQYAGGRSVLASLWGVYDTSTARVMKRFYGYLRSGKTKDEALRAAQIDQIREKPALAHPFHWAAFQLTGDWK
jgi:CHAT domain-containing protein/tetratricopeptide (TPR) repeat protein